MEYDSLPHCCGVIEIGEVESLNDRWDSGNRTDLHTVLCRIQRDHFKRPYYESSSGSLLLQVHCTQDTPQDVIDDLIKTGFKVKYTFTNVNTGNTITSYMRKVGKRSIQRMINLLKESK
jgi:hypothetical protein